jgi:hypothetical protein
MDISAVGSFLCDESAVFNVIIKKDFVQRTLYSTYKVIQEEMPIFW